MAQQLEALRQQASMREMDMVRQLEKEQEATRRLQIEAMEVKDRVAYEAYAAEQKERQLIEASKVLRASEPQSCTGRCHLESSPRRWRGLRWSKRRRRCPSERG